MEEMNQENSEIKELSIGDIVKGKVVKVEEKHILVDIGQKVEGIVPISELSALRIDTASDVVNEGDELELQVKKIEDEEIVLSKKKRSLLKRLGRIYKNSSTKIKHLKQ